MKYYHSSTIFLRFSFPLTQFRSLQGKNLFIPQHWEHLATEAKVANASLTLTWSTSFHPVGPSLSFTPSLLTFPSKGGNLPLPWRLCSNLSSISPRSFPLSLFLSLLALLSSSISNTRLTRLRLMFADTGIRVSVSLVLCSQHGRGQRPKEKEKNQSWTRTDGPQNLPVTSSSLYGDQRVDLSRPSAHTLIFFPLLGASTIIAVPIDSIIDHPSTMTTGIRDAGRADRRRGESDLGYRENRSTNAIP